MRKYYYLMIACFCFLTIQAQVTKSSGTYHFPLTTPSTSPPSDIIEDFDSGGNSPNGPNRYTSEGIVLTYNRVGFSGFALKDIDIDLRKEATVEFEYSMATITGSGFGKGEGMTFFLYDAKEPKLTLGYGFEALGYAYNEVNGIIGRKPHLKGSYLAVGFDIGGGFKDWILSNEQRREGISKKRFEEAGYTGQSNFTRYQRNHLTLRGAHASYRQAGGYNGNPVLLTKYYGGSAVNSGDISMATLDYATGKYQFDRNTDATSFDVGNGGTAANPNFQKIRIDFVPFNNEKGIYITIKLIEGNKETTLVNKFEYDTEFKTYDKNDDLYDFKAPIPDKVKIGFSASTGNFTHQKTIIRNVKVTIPGALVIEDTKEEMCVSDSGASKNAEIKVVLFNNISSSIKANTFKFLDENDNEVGTTYNQSNVGRWEYSASKEEVTLTLSNSYFEPEDEAKVYYVIEGTDGKKSQKALIIVKGIACGAVANPHIRVKNKAEKFIN